MPRIALILWFTVYMLSSFGQSKGDRPNIIFILTDDQSPFPVEAENSRASRPFGFNGESRVYTPTIDSLAENGIIYSRAYVSSSVCSPSRYTTLTGRYAGRCQGAAFMEHSPKGELARVQNNAELEEDKMNIARYLKEVGYQTAFIGKSHVIDHHNVGEASRSHKETGMKYYPKDANPRDSGVVAATRYNHDYWVQRVKDQGFDYADAVYAANLRELFNRKLNVHNIEYKNQAVLDFIDQSGDEPFFIFYSETVPHGPGPWRKNNGKYIHGLDANPRFTGEGYLKRAYPNMPSRQQILDEVKAMDGKDLDQAWLTWLDYSVKAIVKKLREQGKLENTLFVITSDHGDRNFGKSTNYENGVKVPLAMFWPAGIKPGLVYQDLVQNTDFVPTFLDIAGRTDLNELELDGVSLSKTFDGRQEPVHDHLYFEIGYSRAVMTKEWKYIAVRYDKESQRKIDAGEKFNGWRDELIDRPYYIRNSSLGFRSAQAHPFYFDSDQLFNLGNDPEESQNLNDKNASKLAEMKEALSGYLKSFPNRPYGEFTD